MEETITTDSFLSNLSSDYVDYGGNTEHPCFVLPELKAIAVVCMVISPCGLVENVLVMWFLGCRMKLNRVTTTIRNLAFVDFFLLIVCFLLMLSVLTLPAFCFNDSISSYLDLVFLAAGLCQFFGLSSLGLLAAVSVDRCLAVWFPTRYNRRCQKHFSNIIFLVVIGLIALFYFLRYLSSSFARSYAGVVIAICTILSSLMLVSNLALFIKLQGGSQRRPPGKLDIAVLLNMIFSFALGIPFIVEVFLYLPDSYVLFPEISSTISFLLASLNSSIKPFFYFLVGSCKQCHFQHSMNTAFQRVFEEEATSRKRSQDPGVAVVESTL